MAPALILAEASDGNRRPQRQPRQQLDRLPGVRPVEFALVRLEELTSDGGIS